MKFPKYREKDTHSGTKKLQDKKETLRDLLITLNHRLRVLKAAREKGQVTYEGRQIRITPDNPVGTFKAKGARKDVSLICERAQTVYSISPRNHSLKIEPERKLSVIKIT